MLHSFEKNACPTLPKSSHSYRLFFSWTQQYSILHVQYILYCTYHRRRINTKRRQRPLSAWGMELIQFLAALSILHQDDMKKRMNRIMATLWNEFLFQNTIPTQSFCIVHENLRSKCETLSPTERKPCYMFRLLDKYTCTVYTTVPHHPS